MNYPKITFDIPTYNAEEHLAACLESIRSQRYPDEKIEILVADGGSEDKTVEIAKKFGAKVFDNPKKLADYGAKINARNATGDLFVIFAADNELVSSNWAKKVAGIFNENRDIVSIWGKIVSGKADPPINKYYELIQNDPFTNFMNKNLQEYLKKAERRSSEGEEYFVFNVETSKPLVWGANGLIYRLKAVKDIILQDKFVGDNDVFQTLIEKGNNKVAYMPSLNTYHHHLKSLGHWVVKWKRNYTKHFLNERGTRNLNWAFIKGFYSKLAMWLIYSLVPIFSMVDTIYKIIKDRNLYWAYHPLACLTQSATYLYLTLSTESGREMVRDLLANVVNP